MLSVIVPTLNAELHLPNILEQMQGVVDDIVVSDGGSEDKTLAVALGYGVRICIGCKGRGWQLARGAHWAEARVQAEQNDWMLFVHADTVLSKDWLEAVETHMRDFPQHAGYFRYQLDTQGIWPRLVAALVSLRSRICALPYGDQGLLISRTLYEDVGGFPDWELFEDVAIIRAIGRQRLQQLNASAITSAERYVRDGYVKRGLRNLGLITRFYLGADPQKLKDIYYK